MCALVEKSCARARAQLRGNSGWKGGQKGLRTSALLNMAKRAYKHTVISYIVPDGT